WDTRDCYCCCGCYAYGTPIATPDGEKAIEEFQIGDLVSVANLESTGETLRLSWAAKPVKFSGGTSPLPKGAAHYPPMIFLNYGEERKNIISTMDQLFLLANGKVKQADKLSIHDLLVAPDGTPVKINAIKLGEYSGGIHHIAISDHFTQTLDGHLLNSNGVVTADFSVQIQTEQLGNLLEEGPAIGEPAYHEIHEQHAMGVHSYHHPDLEDEVDVPHSLKLYTGESVYIPPTARSFITQAQGIDINNNPDVRKRPLSNHVGANDLKTVFKHCRAYYPDINFTLVWEDSIPNVYAFEYLGQKQVVVSGQLLRTDGIYWQAMALVVAQAIASFHEPGGEPRQELLPRGLADYYGVGLIMSIVWEFYYRKTVKAGMEQINNFLSYISSENQQGNPNNPLEEPSIECRQETMEEGAFGGTLPACAGGLLRLLDAIPGEVVDGKPTIVFSFNFELDESAAKEMTNYQVEPTVDLTAVQVDSTDLFRVTLVGDFAPKTNYTITVTNLTSKDGIALDPKHNFANIQLPLPKPKLKVTGEEVGETPEGKPFVILNFNEPLDVASAENLDNYQVTGRVQLTSAKVNEDDQSKVTLLGNFAPKTDYEVVVSNVTSAEGASLDTEHNYARFKTH
ncbi:hypothetical protein, partial [Moorena sp. SIO4G3]|uniref:Ig-like domain-containing protein n=1 Tax=Moorena sp. SIO4G3 TaxID=2607821 RepID=UPI00142C833C